MKHIANTLARRQIAAEVGEVVSTYRKYIDLVVKAMQQGISHDAIVNDLKAEQERVRKRSHQGDAIFQQGVVNSKNACIKAIDMILDELTAEPRKINP